MESTHREDAVWSQAASASDAQLLGEDPRLRGGATPDASEERAALAPDGVLIRTPVVEVFVYLPLNKDD